MAHVGECQYNFRLEKYGRPSLRACVITHAEEAAGSRYRKGSTTLKSHIFALSLTLLHLKYMQLFRRSHNKY